MINSKTLNLVLNILRLKEARTANSRFAKAGVSCLYGREVLNSSFVHLMKFSAKNPRLRKAAKRCEQVLPHSTNGTAVFFDRLQATLIDFIFLR